MLSVYIYIWPTCFSLYMCAFIFNNNFIVSHRLRRCTGAVFFKDDHRRRNEFRIGEVQTFSESDSRSIRNLSCWFQIGENSLSLHLNIFWCAHARKMIYIGFFSKQSNTSLYFMLCYSLKAHIKRS